jgi:hypothetical protein
MRQYYFDSRFSADILSGKKTMTVRRVWKNRVRKGDLLFLHIDLPKRKSTIVVKAFCSDVYPVYVSADSITVRKRELSASEIQEFTRKGGFRTFAEMTLFFDQRYSLPFTGQCICWKPLRRSVDKQKEANSESCVTRQPSHDSG